MFKLFVMRKRSFDSEVSEQGDLADLRYICCGKRQIGSRTLGSHDVIYLSRSISQPRKLSSMIYIVHLSIALLRIYD